MQVHGPSPPFPAAFLEFASRFDRGEFWESHEVLETPWRVNRSSFYKGMILLASAWVHVQRGNPRGIVAQLDKAVRHLGPYRPAYLGLDVDSILAHAARCRARVAAHPVGAPAEWTELAPPIRLRPDPALLRGTEVELREIG